MKVRAIWGAATAAGLSVPVAFAADLPLPQNTGSPLSSPANFYNYYVHVGPAALIFDAAARIRTPIGRFPGATIKIAPQVTAAAEIGYRFTSNWAASLTVGVPPTQTIEGAGSITGLGKLGSNLYGPVSLTGHYHFTNFGAFQPYVGGGVVYMISFDSDDAAVRDLKVRSALGAVAQIGADYMISDQLGLFVDFKKAYLRTKATGTLGFIPISAKVTLDPYVVSGGLTYRF